ncbi:type II secretion system F family protein [Streptomyces zagrosensis]|uniref:Pilus assembly protein TadC n=1 Tax=Streptomyces zagrosensis TaxID=1042984 RepID=A0A7W9QGY9_9ACTN|nr:type II secretion system F family protein [Streptomyces zagrosensis]MBB5939508.1 pilus assembly protein TadC [Streptomyces zagrosensis]
MRKRLTAIGCGCLGPILLDGWVGYVVGLALACGAWRWWRGGEAERSEGRLRGGGQEAASSGLTSSEASTAAAQLPLAADLLAACLAAGAEPRDAAEAVGSSLGGPVGQRLTRVAAELRLGGDLAEAWGQVGALPGATGLARSLERAAVTGAPAVEPVTRFAADCRADRGRAATARARRAGVMATAPLGLCFLPAFLLVGVAPVVIGLADGLLST